MKNILNYLLVLLLLNSQTVQSQIWQTLGNGLENLVSNGVTCLYPDPLTGKLIIGGGFTDTSNGDTLVKICSWDGVTLEQLGCGLDWQPGEALPLVPGWVTAITRYRDTLLICAGVQQACGNNLGTFLKLNGNTWQKFSNHTVFPGALRTHQDTLYASGIDLVGDYDCNGLAKWDGTNWLPVHNLPLFNTTWEINYNNVATFEWYQDQLYIGGNWGNNTMTENISDLARWDGQQWTSVGNGLVGSLTMVSKLLVFKNKLIVVGTFGGPQNPGNGVAAWDGNSWDNMQGGVANTLPVQSPPIVRDAWADEDYLYVVGSFRFAGGQPADYVARWDGKQWCSFGHGPYYDNYYYWDNVLKSVAVYNNELIVGGDFYNAGDFLNLNLIAKFSGAPECLPIHIESDAAPIQFFTLHPNPATHSLTLTAGQAMPAGTWVQMHDMAGRVVHSERLPVRTTTHTVDVAALAPGVYTCTLQHQSQRYQTIRWVRE